MLTPNNGKLIVGVDWEDKGYVEFIRTDSDPLNLIPKPAFIYSELGFQTGGDVNPQLIYPPDPLFKDINFPNNIGQAVNPYGVEIVNLRYADGAFSGDAKFGTAGTNHAIPIDPSTDYTIWAWVATNHVYTNDGSHSLTIEAIEFDSPGTSITATANQNFDAVGGLDVQAVSISITSNSSSHHLCIWFNKTDSVDSSFEMAILGLMLLPGTVSDEPLWNNGTPLGYLDDITSYSLAVQGNIGKKNWENILMDEGVLTITLNNADKRFSPEYTDSPIFGYVAPYKRVWVLVSDHNNQYHMLWSGWTQQIAVVPGTSESRQATLTCRQGKYNIEAQDESLLISQASKLSAELVESLFGGGYEIPTGSLQTGSIVSDHIIQNISDGDTGITVPIFGVDFVGQPGANKYLTELQNVSELNGNFLFLNRYGRVTFRTFPTVKAETPTELPYGLCLNATYLYAPIDLYKEIVVNYDVYANASDIEMQGQDQIIPSGAVDFSFRIDPKYNGKPLIGDVVLDVSAFQPVDYTASPSGGTVNSAFVEHNEGVYTWYNGLAQNSTDLEYRLSLISRDSGSVWYAVQINKVETIVSSLVRGLPTLSYNNTLVTSDTMAADFAQQQADRRANIVAWFDTATVTNKNADSTDVIVGKTLGDTVYLQEEQSGNFAKALIIIGESFNYVPGYLQMQYAFAPTGGDVLAVAFTYSPSELTVDFTDTSLESAPSGYAWTFGD